MRDYRLLENKIGYSFKTPAHLVLALTHPSYHEKHNQRMEFLGDAVLELCISRFLYDSEPPLQEGEMTRMRASLVCENTLYHIALQLELGKFILMEKSCETGGGRNRKSILSDALEAVLAAVFLDGGLESAMNVIMRFWPTAATALAEEIDSKSTLQEYLQARERAVPDYTVISEEGPAHNKVFEVSLQIDGQVVSHGRGTSKKRAEQDAAHAALSKLLALGDVNETEKA